MNRAIKKNFTRLKKEPNFRFISYLMLILIIISTVLLSINAVGTSYNYTLGDIAREDIRITREIQYHNEAESETARKRAAEEVPLVFDKDQSILFESIAGIEKLFSSAVRVLADNPPTRSEDRTFQLIALKDILDKNSTYDDRTLWHILQTNNIDRLKITVKRILIFIYDIGIIDNSFQAPADNKNENIAIRVINTQEEPGEKSASLRDIKTLSNIQKDLSKICYSISADKSGDRLHAIYDIIYKELRPNLKFNPEETGIRVQEKLKTVKPVMGVLKKGQMIAREGDTITTESLNKIDILNRNTASTNITYIIGILLLQLTILLITIFFAGGEDDRYVRSRKIPIITFSLVIIFILYAFTLSRMENIYNSNLLIGLLLPIPFVIMTITTLFEDRFIAMLVSIFIIFFSLVISLASLASILVSISSAILGYIVVRDVEKRTDFLRGGVTIGIVNSIIIVAIGLMEEYSAASIFKNIELAFAHGILNSIFVVGIIPIYENIFGITTRFKLLELSDLNSKIFKKMLIKAPGTYNHSLIVANMAEAACEAIGANSVLARVGGYYHDIGKVNNAKYFVENKSNSSETVDLPPEDYTKLIISHVEAGVELAKENKIPDSIIDFIKEHHGTSTMTYFYHQALEEAESTGDTDVDREDFQYPGPKPQSRETAVVMIADSVEAASRSMQDPSSIKLEGLVKKIIYNKLNEGQLENSNLNMSDLRLIQISINRILNGIFHTRLEYPENEAIKELEEKVINSNDKEDDQD